MFLIFRIVFLGCLFWFLKPSYESIYYYHFGEVTNSDALYPYLFIQDFNESPSFSKGWLTPPSHCFFPDLIFFYAILIFTKDIFLTHYLFAFFCFLSVLFLFRSLGLPRSVGLVVALVLLRLGEYFPSSWGQFFLPSFHGTEFFLIGLVIYTLRKNEMSIFKFSIPFGIILAVSIHSELWFLVHSLIPICFYFLKKTKFNPKQLLTASGTSILFYFLLLKTQSQLGMGSYLPKQFPLKDYLKRSFHELSFSPLDYIGDLLSLTKLLPLNDIFMPAFVIMIFILVFDFTKGRVQTKDWILPLGFISSVLFIKLSGLEPNARYFYFLPISCIALFFTKISSYPFLRKAISYLCLISLIFYSHQFWQNDFIKKKTELSRSKHERRLHCVTETSSAWGNQPGASTYWPVKYLRAFSDSAVKLVPFTPDGIYYPWVHNTNWDLPEVKPAPDLFSWGIVAKNESTLFGKPAIQRVECEDWALIRISNR